MTDLELIYMDGNGPAMYFFLEAMALPVMQIPAIGWVVFFSLYYILEFLWYFCVILFWVTFGGNSDPDKYYDPNQLYDEGNSYLSST